MDHTATETTHNKTMRRLDPLVGTWNDGQTTFEWLGGTGILVETQRSPSPEFPSATWVIGLDDQAEDVYIALYADSRGVSRIYRMTFDGKRWKIWREARGFSQRFIATLSADGKKLAGAWESSDNGTDWKHDFDLTFTKDGSPQAPTCHERR